MNFIHIIFDKYCSKRTFGEKQLSVILISLITFKNDMINWVCVRFRVSEFLKLNIDNYIFFPFENLDDHKLSGYFLPAAAHQEQLCV